MQIVGDVLRVTNDFGIEGVNITLLLRKANLSYNRLAKISKQLMSAGLLEEKAEEGKRVYLITDKGKEYLRTYEQFESLASSFGLEL
jgi:predicted transcriptional regulator